MPKLDQGGDDEWTTGIFQCCEDCAGACDIVCCWPCMYGRQCTALKGDPQGGMDIPACALAFFCSWASPCLLFSIRQRIRQRFGINEGSTIGDLASVFCCAACTHCQHHRELSNRGFWPGGCVCSSSPPGGIG